MHVADRDVPSRGPSQKCTPVHWYLAVLDLPPRAEALASSSYCLTFSRKHPQQCLVSFHLWCRYVAPNDGQRSRLPAVLTGPPLAVYAPFLSFNDQIHVFHSSSSSMLHDIYVITTKVLLFAATSINLHNVPTSITSCRPSRPRSPVYSSQRSSSM